MGQDQFSQQDPTQQHAQPGSGSETVKYPGRTEEMDVQPDHGEQTYRGIGRLEGKKAVITGGDSGIGRAVALAFAREGADLLISYLESEEQDAQKTVALVEEAGHRAVTVSGDIREEAHCRHVVDRAVEEFGHIDVLVSNAAYQMSRNGGIADITTNELDRVFKTNVYAMFWLCKAAIPHMPPGSTIVTSSSVQAFQPSPHLLDYAASKGAIVNFTKALGANLVEKGIRVNSADPRDHARGDGRVLRATVTHGTGGAARRARPHLRLPRLPGIQLHHLGGPRGHRRFPNHLSRRTPLQHPAIGTRPVWTVFLVARQDGVDPTNGPTGPTGGAHPSRSDPEVAR